MIQSGGFRWGDERRTDGGDGGVSCCCGVGRYRRNRQHLRKGDSPPNEESEILQTPKPAAEEAPTGDDCLMRADDAGPHTEQLQPMQESVEEAPPTLTI